MSKGGDPPRRRPGPAPAAAPAPAGRPCLGRGGSRRRAPPRPAAAPAAELPPLGPVSALSPLNPEETKYPACISYMNRYELMYTMRRMEIAADMMYKAKLIRGFCHLWAPPGGCVCVGGRGLCLVCGCVCVRVG
jgi:hypothetical protein